METMKTLANRRRNRVLVSETRQQNIPTGPSLSHLIFLRSETKEYLRVQNKKSVQRIFSQKQGYRISTGPKQSHLTFLRSETTESLRVQHQVLQRKFSQKRGYRISTGQTQRPLTFLRSEAIESLRVQHRVLQRIFSQKRGYRISTGPIQSPIQISSQKRGYRNSMGPTQSPIEDLFSEARSLNLHCSQLYRLYACINMHSLSKVPGAMKYPDHFFNCLMFMEYDSPLSNVQNVFSTKVATESVL